MLQPVQGKVLYIVDLPKVPDVAVTGLGWEAPYAEALTLAIVKGLINKPGKYGIEVDHTSGTWHAYEVKE